MYNIKRAIRSKNYIYVIHLQKKWFCSLLWLFLLLVDKSVLDLSENWIESFDARSQRLLEFLNTCALSQLFRSSSAFAFEQVRSLQEIVLRYQKHLVNCSQSVICFMVIDLTHYLVPTLASSTTWWWVVACERSSSSDHHPVVAVDWLGLNKEATFSIDYSSSSCTILFALIGVCECTVGKRDLGSELKRISCLLVRLNFTVLRVVHPAAIA